MNVCRFVIAGVMLLGMLIALPGCGSEKPSWSAADLDRVQESLKSSLEAWKKGETLDQWKKKSPTISMNDPDWKAGVRLLDFEIKKTEGVQGQNARGWTVLSLQNRQGKKSQAEVVFEINATKDIVIARDAFN